MKKEIVNLTGLFEAAFGTAKIDNPEDLNLLIEALEEVGDVPFNEKNVLKVQEIVKREEKRRQV